MSLKPNKPKTILANSASSEDATASITVITAAKSVVCALAKAGEPLAQDFSLTLCLT
jgi:hypothetical protein